ncbi:MAG TPA: DUF99 family protein [Thermoplasmata archaeon]|nr:DUF99 family protein [Thermoplasmata archaeon]
MRRALAKAHVTVVAVDDGAFRRTDARAPIAAVVCAGAERVVGVSIGSVAVDGDDATGRIAALVRAAPDRVGLRAVLVDGIAMGGFNVLDLDRLHDAVGLPVVSVTRRRPDAAKIAAAIRTYFPRDAARRLARLRAHRLFPVPTAARPILAAVVGASRTDAIRLVARLTVQGHWPEPLRLAHLVARAVGLRDARTNA